mmetsp:Transcript_6975/g.10667  ORF Transcript_6975/g.10667 Transcript_6975/m.10667 type:complete len:259 (-) Transcript_6975:78-854(-)
MELLLEALEELGEFVVNAKDENGFTPLHEAVASGNLEVVQYLIDHGSDINERTNEGEGGTALWWAQEELGDEHPIVDLLMHLGADFIGPDSDSDDSDDEEEEEELLSCGGSLPQLTLTQRISGCVICMVAGYLLSLGSLLRFAKLVTGNPVPFVVNSTAGNLIALCGSCFLSGPTAQAKKMFGDGRKTATIMLVVSLFLTVCVLLVGDKLPLRGLILLVLILSQYASITWYCLSYIPFAQGIVKKWCYETVGLDESES